MIELTLLIIVICLLIYYLVSSKIGIGTPWAVVGSYSMVPVLDIGDIVLLKPINPYNLHVGQVIVYIAQVYGERLEIVHRIYEIYRYDGKILIRTKGDANPVPDPWMVRPSQIRGVVYLVIPHVGLIGLVLRDFFIRGRASVIALLLLGLFYVLITYLLCRIAEER
ncbi:MAG: signal peptidase I [Crenarchaeota archaeon]|nr:signal peptidase I [Thermoproteota archaeon]